MNLLEKMKQEISNLKTNNPYVIARYIYIRMGEIFNYDPFYIFADSNEKEEIKNSGVDIENITEFYLVCFKWAKLYVRLLKEFNINAVEISDERHAAVIIYIDDHRFLADLTTENLDITWIKFGLPIQKFHQIYKKPEENEFNFTNIDKIIYTKGALLEDLLNQIRKELQMLRDKLTEEQFIDLTFKFIGNIMNQKRENIGFVSGVTFINYLIKDFIGNTKNISYNHFIDKFQGIYIEVYEIKMINKVSYFAYQENERGIYEFREITKDNVKIFITKYNLKNSSLEENKFSEFSKVRKIDA